MKVPTIVTWMALAIVGVTALAYWDEERESKAALADFAEEQTRLAVSLAAAVGDRLSESTQPPDAHLERLLQPARTIERPGSLRVLLRSPHAEAFIDSSGQLVPSAPLDGALQQGLDSLRLTRSDAASLGLPARTALAGISGVDTVAGHYGIVVLATALVERDRELRARWRLVLGVLVASGLVLAFGGLATRERRKELELAHRLAISTLQTERDERLIRADKLATMGALATGIAHEVATPLGVILGRAEQLLPKQGDERSRRAVETIATQTQRIDQVIRGFLALARGRQAALERSAPAALAQAAIELVEHRFEKANVQLVSDVASDLPSVACEARLFEQVLVNLLLNACDACAARGRVSLSVRADQGRVAFVVSDDGAGISPERMERVTEPFFTTKAEGEGTGLGLAIASEIVKHHCGSLTLRPRHPGPGTSAAVELPAVESERA